MFIKRINNGSWDDGIYYFKDPECTILHREDGPAVEYANGNKRWFLNGKLHREDGPAIEHVSGHKEWYFNGKLHREDGPAVEWNNGNKSYYLNDKYFTKQEYIEYIKNKIICPAKKSKIIKQCT